MRLVFINHAHPDTPHVSAMRMYYFANAMAARGHQVALLTGESPLQPGQGLGTGQVAAAVAGHDWTQPLVLPVLERSAAARAVIHDRDDLPPLLRKARTAWRLLCGDGIHGQWVANARPVLDSLAEVFEPELVWATFGNTSNLRLGQWLAGRARCRWIADIKDNWQAFIPRGLRRAVAWRFRNAAGLTSNADLHLQAAADWGDSRPAAVIYSGVAAPFFGTAENDERQSWRQQVLLVGGTYSSANLQCFLTALASWVDSLAASEREQLCFVYAGSDVKQVNDAMQLTPLSCASRIMAQRPVEELASHARGSLMNCYLVSHSSFHHKLLELLVAGRPVVCFPGEHPESRRLAAGVATGFHACTDPGELEAAFNTIWGNRTAKEIEQSSPPWRWGDFAVELESFFAGLIQEQGKPCAV